MDHLGRALWPARRRRRPRIARLLQEGKDGKAQRLATGVCAFDNIGAHGACQQQVIRGRPARWVLAASWIPRTTASTSSRAWNASSASSGNRAGGPR